MSNTVTLSTLNSDDEANPNPDDYRLYDYDSADHVSAEALGLDDKEYRELIKESLYDADNPCGVVSTRDGTRVYAQA